MKPARRVEDTFNILAYIKVQLGGFCVHLATGKEETFNILGISKVTERRHPYQILLPGGKLNFNQIYWQFHIVTFYLFSV